MEISVVDEREQQNVLGYCLQGDRGFSTPSPDREAKYRLCRLDRLNWCIQFRRGKRKGVDRWESAYFYPKLEQAAQAMIDLLVLDGKPGPIDDLRRLISEVEDAKHEVLENITREAGKK